MKVKRVISLLTLALAGAFFSAHAEGLASNQAQFGSAAVGGVEKIKSKLQPLPLSEGFQFQQVQPSVGQGLSAYSTQVAGPTIYSKNFLYGAAFPISGTIPAGSAVTTINWTYDISYKPAGFVAFLCWQSTSYCLNITPYGAGSTEAFKGFSAASPFYIYYGVAGTGLLSPYPASRINTITVGYAF